MRGPSRLPVESRHKEDEIEEDLLAITITVWSHCGPPIVGRHDVSQACSKLGGKGRVLARPGRVVREVAYREGLFSNGMRGG